MIGNELQGFGADQGQNHDHEVAVARTRFIWYAWTGEGAGRTPPGRGSSERGLSCPGDVPQQHSKASLGQRSGLGSLWPGFSVSVIGRC